MITRRLFLGLGFLTWLYYLLLFRPDSPKSMEWINVLLLLAPLFLIPTGLRLINRYFFSITYSSASIFLYALSLTIGFMLSPGLPAGLLAIPWLLATLGLAIQFLGTLLPDLGWRRFIQLPAPFLCIGAALLFLPVGAVWALADRLGWRLLGFDPVMLRLTAVHFHYAGFLLPLTGGLILRNRLPRSLIKWTSWSMITGIPLVALGILTTHAGGPPAFEVFAVVLLAAAGLVCAALHFYFAIRPPARWQGNRWIWLPGGLCLATGLILAVLYGIRHYHPLPWMSIPWMYAVHGTLNALGLALLTLGWSIRKLKLKKGKLEFED